VPFRMKPICFVVVLVALPGSLQLFGIRDSAATTGSADHGRTITVHATAKHSKSASSAPSGASSNSSANPCSFVPDVLVIQPFLEGYGVDNWYESACSAYNVVEKVLYWLASLQAYDPGPALTPLQEAQSAESSMTLPSPTIFTNPSGSSFVNLPTWLWVSPSIWHPWTTTATAADVSASATATPIQVDFSMGNGANEICSGPGSAYNPNDVIPDQHTSCSYTYRSSSAGQPTDSNANSASFLITATITWRVNWVAIGAPGGGTLPSLITSSTMPLRVQQVESVNGL